MGKQKVESLLKKLDLFGDFAKLNFSQQNAVTKSLEVEDYCLIFGMPGTGKSTTITFLLQLLNKLKKKVLVATYTHSALTHLLLKLAAKKVPFVYAGKMTPQCDSVVAENHIRAISDRCDKDQTFYRRIENNFIFAATSLSTGSSFLQSQNFDYCIIDEASQMSEIACLGGLRLADKFILVGDHFQLSPLVRSDAAKRAGMEISLFERLFAEHKTSTIALTSQYRMNSDILKLPNNLFYQNKLFCGSEKVKTAVLSVVASETKTALLPKWLKSVLSPKNSLIFLNTDKMEAIERREKNSDREIIINKGELVVIEKILDLFESAGLAKSQISVLSTYKSQTTFLQTKLSKYGVEIKTIDKFQGSENDCVLVSLVRSNEKQKLGKLIKNKKRLNVAITRAKKKLILIGSLKTLRSDRFLEKMLLLLQKDNKIINI